MGVEIERKFLIDKNIWQPGVPGVNIRQGYIVADEERTVRVRTKGQKGYLTIKGVTDGISRLEMEYEIPYQDAEKLLNEVCLTPLIEIDVFYGDNAGLIVAEVELSSIDEKIDLPDWITREVSDDKRYYNACLIKQPFKNW